MERVSHRLALADDGTLDTVIRCRCGAEFRYNFEGTFDTGEAYSNAQPGESYDQFVAWALEDAANEHDEQLDNA